MPVVEVDIFGGFVDNFSDERVELLFSEDSFQVDKEFELGLVAEETVFWSLV